MAFSVKELPEAIQGVKILQSLTSNAHLGTQLCPIFGYANYTYSESSDYEKTILCHEAESFLHIDFCHDIFDCSLFVRQSL